MDQPTEQIQSELENFREQWRAEVSARSKNTASSSRQAQQQQRTTSSQAGPSESADRKRHEEAEAAAKHMVSAAQSTEYIANVSLTTDRMQEEVRKRELQKRLQAATQKRMWAEQEEKKATPKPDEIDPMDESDTEEVDWDQLQKTEDEQVKDQDDNVGSTLSIFIL